MNISQAYILISIIVLAIIAIIVIIRRKKEHKPLSKLAMFAMSLVVLGIVFTSQGRLVSYSFFGAGIILSIIDAIKNLKSKQS